jgi:outer membrane protein OmpA-like peptidoglycan-associated protein
MRIHYFACVVALAACVSAPAAAQSKQSDEERDFVPGEKVIFYDDFTDMAKGAAPPHWKVRGGVVRLSPDGRLQLRGDGTMYANVKTLPKNYTVEMEILPEYADGTRYVNWMFTDKADESVWDIGYQFDPGEISVFLSVGHGHSDYEGHPHASIKIDYGKPIRLALWYQDSRIRAYVNDERAIDVNQVEFKPSTVALVEYNVGDTPVYIISARMAESMPDISQTMFSTGRYVSHNILFDVNSDKLRSESANVIKEIAAALQKQPSLKVRIEGHTDSTGDAAKNLDLSKRRAESVKAALVKLGIDAARLTTEGFGQTKPLSTNDTPQGRAENRRVEFVKT